MNANIAVLITVFNRELFLEQLCIEIDKYILVHENVKQVVFLDDLSSDSSFDILTSFDFIFKEKVTIVRNERNLGQFKARNRIVEFVNKEINFLKYLDSDDLPYEHTISDFNKSFNIFPERSIFISASRAHFPQKYPFLYDKQNFINDYLGKTWIAEGPSSWFVRKDFFQRMGKFNENGRVNEDVVLLIKCFLESEAVIIRPSNIWYRIHDDQELSKGTMQLEYERYEYLLDETVLKNCSEKDKLVIKKLRFREFLKLIYLQKYRKALLKLKTWLKIL